MTCSDHGGVWLQGHGAGFAFPCIPCPLSAASLCVQAESGPRQSSPGSSSPSVHRAGLWQGRRYSQRPVCFWVGSQWALQTVKGPVLHAQPNGFAFAASCAGSSAFPPGPPRLSEHHVTQSCTHSVPEPVRPSPITTELFPWLLPSAPAVMFVTRISEEGVPS